jgi:hypothetical protein
MANFIRYALATICFAAGVGFLELWWRSQTKFDWWEGPSNLAPKRANCLLASRGQFQLRLWSEAESSGQTSKWNYYSGDLPNVYDEDSLRNSDKFMVTAHAIHFPTWYPGLIFALAGVGVIRFRRRFSIRSALIATTVVAALIGMAVIL